MISTSIASKVHGLIPKHTTSVISKLDEKCSKVSKRLMHDSQGSKKALVITGGKAGVSASLLLEGLDRGYQIYACTPDNPLITHKNIQWIVMPIEDSSKKTSWFEVFKKVSEVTDDLAVVHTIGAGSARKGHPISEDIERPAYAMLEALEESKIARKYLGSFSSIAASKLPNDAESLIKYGEEAIAYVQARQNVDLTFHAKTSIPCTTIRPDYIFQKLYKDFIVPPIVHAYSLEQFAFSLIHPIIGSGKQILQPVYIEDVAKAVLNGIEKGENCIVDGVGADHLTQEETIKLFVKLGSGKYKPLPIPLDMAKVIAKHFSKGRLAPYAVALMEHLEENNSPLSHKPFEQLVGAPLISIKDIYQHADLVQLPTNDPIFEHMLEILICVRQNPEARRDFLRVVRKYGFMLFIEAVKQQFTNNNQL